MFENELRACRDGWCHDRVDSMKVNLACLSLAACLFASCEKSGNKANTEETSSQKPKTETRSDAPMIASKPAPAAYDLPNTNTGNTIDPPLTHPANADMIRPAGIAAGDASWDSLTAEQKLEKFSSSGIARMPKDVSDKLIGNATSAGAADAQIQFITQRAAAWHQIDEFKQGVNDIPEHMRMQLLEKLYTKHGDSWVDMLPEIEEQMAASRKVMELRLNGIPGMSPDESQDLLIKALEKHGSDYKTILSIAEQRVRK
jgi:hypothetical protein